jgi:hypothetical protein
LEQLDRPTLDFLSSREALKMLPELAIWQQRTDLPCTPPYIISDDYSVRKSELLKLMVDYYTEGRRKALEGYMLQRMYIMMCIAMAVRIRWPPHVFCHTCVTSDNLSPLTLWLIHVARGTRQSTNLDGIGKIDLWMA